MVFPDPAEEQLTKTVRRQAIAPKAARDAVHGIDERCGTVSRVLGR